MWVTWSFKVIGNGTTRYITYEFLLLLHCNYTALSCIVSEIKRDIGRKGQFFHTPVPFNLHGHLEPL